MALLPADQDTESVESVSNQIITKIPKTLNCKRSKLIVHLDLNNTVLLSDTVTRQGPRRALSSFLTTVTWGRINKEVSAVLLTPMGNIPTSEEEGKSTNTNFALEKDFSEHPSSHSQVGGKDVKVQLLGKWEWLSNVPSLNPPCDGAVSYDSQFGKLLDFTETTDGCLFKKIFTDHLQNMEWTDPHDELLSVTDEDGKEYHWILPSFFELVDCLSSQDREFAIILRTFGSDLCRTLKTIQVTLSGQHPQYQHLQMKHLPLRTAPGKIRCNKKDVVLTMGSERISTQSGARALYHYFSSLEGIVGFQDHFDWWARNSFSNRGGKPFWIDPSETGIQHIFIDDNIRLNDADSIVHPQVFVEDGAGTRTVPTSELYDICLVQTDLLGAIRDRCYFIKCVQQCEANYSNYTAFTH